jgi:predicted O-methyltransferase YrrM
VLRKREAERARMLAMLPAEGSCAEIGTWRGDFAAVILADRRPSRLYLVDPWEHRTDEAYEKASYGGKMDGGQQALDEMHQSVVERFAGEISAGQVIVLRRRSTDAAGTFAPESLDWVYIDGDHSYEGVSADLEAYFPAVKPGGLIAGDDYGHQGSWFEDGVKRAVDEVAGRCAGLEVIGTQFVLRKP